MLSNFYAIFWTTICFFMNLTLILVSIKNSYKKNNIEGNFFIKGSWFWGSLFVGFISFFIMISYLTIDDKKYRQSNDFFFTKTKVLFYPIFFIITFVVMYVFIITNKKIGEILRNSKYLELEHIFFFGSIFVSIIYNIIILRENKHPDAKLTFKLLLFNLVSFVCIDPFLIILYSFSSNWDEKSTIIINNTLTVSFIILIFSFLFQFYIWFIHNKLFLWWQKRKIKKLG